jgi:YesN/AraC family two-component response regulator
MKCIIVDDEPIARKGVKKLAEEIPALELLTVSTAQRQPPFS